MTDLVTTIRNLIADDDFGNGHSVPLGYVALAMNKKATDLGLFELHKKGTVTLISLDDPLDERHGGPVIKHPHCDEIEYHCVALPL